MTILLRPVTDRANLVATIVASEPVEKKATRSTPVISPIIWATLAAFGVCGPKGAPRAISDVMASLTNETLCPKSDTPNPMVIST